MTREHKLALIVGFSLILLVGVLISDHLSRARQAKIVPVGMGEAQIAEVRPIDPLRNTDGNAAMPQPPQNPVTVVQQTPADAGATSPVTPPTTLTTGITPPATPGLGGNEPRQIREWTNPVNTASATTPQHDDLQRELAKIGSWIDNSGTIHLATVADPARANSTQTSSLLTGPKPTTPAPATDSIKVYTVQKGDTLLKIAQATYGTGRLWQQLARYNNISENSLRLGARIKIPSREVLTGKPTETAAKPTTPSAPATTKSQPARLTPLPARPAEVRYATYTVKSGDTLGHISQRVLGTSKRTQDIIDLNKLDDEDSIPVGTVLKMPVKG